MDRTKYLIVEYGGWEHLIPAEKIAGHRAKYYAENDPDTDYQAELDYAMSENCGEVYEWFNNNMNWEDVAGWVVQSKSLAPTEPPTPRYPDWQSKIEERDTVTPETPDGH